MDQHDLTLHDRVQRSYRLRQDPLPAPHKSHRRARYHHARSQPRFPAPEALSDACSRNVRAPPRSRFLVRVMLEKEERRRAPPPASDHPAVPRGYV